MKTFAILLVIAASAYGNLEGNQTSTGDHFGGSILQMKTTIDNYIIKSMKTLQTITDDVNREYKKTIYFVKTLAVENKDTFYARIEEILTKIDQEMTTMKNVSDEKGVDLSTCRQMAFEIEKSLVKFVNTTSSCILERAVKITQSMEPLQIKLGDMISTLSGFLNATAECVSDPAKSSAKQLMCLVSNNFSASSTIAARMPGLIFESVKYTSKLFWGPVPTGYCLTKNSFAMFYNRSVDKLKLVDRCIEDRYENIIGQLKSDTKNVTKSIV